jgi:hypothetical protein
VAPYIGAGAHPRGAQDESKGPHSLPPLRLQFQSWLCHKAMFFSVSKTKKRQSGRKISFLLPYSLHTHSFLNQPTTYEYQAADSSI